MTHAKESSHNSSGSGVEVACHGLADIITDCPISSSRMAAQKGKDEKQIENLSFNYDDITDCCIKFKDGVLDISSLTELNKGEKNIEVSSYKDSVINENHWSTQKFGLAQLNAEKPYERPLALFNGLDSRDGVFIKFKKGVRKKVHHI